MKRFLKKPLALLLVMVMCVFSIQVGVLADEEIPTNLLFNGDFELSTDGKMPDGWEYTGDLVLSFNGGFEQGIESWNGNLDGYSVIDNTTGYNSNNSLKIDLTTSGSRQFNKNYIPASPGSTYTFSFWYKTSDDFVPLNQNAVYFQLNCYDEWNASVAYKQTTPTQTQGYTFRFPAHTYQRVENGAALVPWNNYEDKIQQFPTNGGIRDYCMNTEWTYAGNNFYDGFSNKYPFPFPNLHHFYLQLVVGVGTGTVWFDDIEIGKIGGIENEIVYMGSNSLIGGGYNDSEKWVSTPMDVEPGKSYVVDGYIRNFHTRTLGTGNTSNPFPPADAVEMLPLDGSPLGTTVYAVFKDADGNVLETREIDHLSDEFWTQLNPTSIPVKAPSDAATMTLEFKINGCSTAYFDEFSVYEAEPQDTSIATDRTLEAEFSDDFTAEPVGVEDLPFSDEAYTINYRAVVLDQGGSVIDDAVPVWSADGDLPEGVSITSAGNILSVSVPAGLEPMSIIPLKAECGGVYRSFYLMVRDYKGVNVSGNSDIKIPDGGDYTATYTAETVDLEDNNLGHTFKYSLSSDIKGVTIDRDTGILTVKKTAEAGDIEIIAVSNECDLLVGSKTVEIKQGKKVEASGDSGNKTGPSGGGSSGNKTGSSGGGGFVSKGDPVIIPTVTTPPAVTEPITPPAVTEPVNDKVFEDLSGYEWAEESILFLTEKGAISGIGDSLFAPERNVTREEFAKILSLAFDISDTDGECDYTDVKDDDWFYPYAASLTKLGVVGGMGDGSFGVGNEISRQDLAVMIYRLALKSDYLFDENVQTELFADDAQVADYAKEAVYKLRAAGIINGLENGEFQPTRGCTRAEAAKLIHTALVTLKTEAAGGNENE